MNPLDIMNHTLKALDDKVRDADIERQRERRWVEERNRELSEYRRRTRNFGIDDATGIRTDGEI